MFHGMAGNQNALKDGRDGHLNQRVNKLDKLRWQKVAAADPDCKSMSDWVIRILNQASQV